MCAGAAPLERPVGERPLHSFHLDAPPAASGRMDTPKGGLAAAALGTAGLTALWCSQPSGQQPQVQRPQPSEPEPEPQPPRQPQSPDKEMMIMSSPRPQPQGKIPKTDSYGELGLRNTRETPGFFQHSVTGEPTARFSMQSPSSSAEPIAFDESDPAVQWMIRTVIEKAHAVGAKVGFCGQAPSNKPAFADFLVKCGIDSISVTPDSFWQVKQQVARSEARSEQAG